MQTAGSLTYGITRDLILSEELSKAHLVFCRKLYVQAEDTDKIAVHATIRKVIAFWTEELWERRQE